MARAMTQPPFTRVGLDHVVFLVDDMARGMGFSVYFRDPSGNLPEIKRPAEYPDGRMQ